MNSPPASCSVRFAAAAAANEMGQEIDNGAVVVERGPAGAPVVLPCIDELCGIGGSSVIK